MVSVDLGSTDDRGQLILIGAIAIALIIVGVVLVVNTALFTEVVGSEGTVETAKESGVAAEELSGSTSAAVHEANVQVDDDITATDSNASDWISDLEPRLVNGSLDGRGAFVDVGYGGPVENGTTVKQEPFERLRSDASGNWQPISGGTEVGFFTLVVDTTSYSSNNFTVTLENSTTRTDESLEVGIDSSGNVDLTGAEATDCTSITPPGNTVKIDVASGRVFEKPDCQFDLLGAVEPGYSVTFENGDDYVGGYTIVTNNESLPTSHFGPNTETGQAIWSYDLEYTYDTGDVVTEGEREVEVYD